MGDMERHRGLLVTLNIGGIATSPSTLETALPERPFYISDFRHFNQREVAGHFVIEANSKQHLNREKFTGDGYIR